MKSASVLLLDSNPESREALERAIEHAGYAVATGVELRRLGRLGWAVQEPLASETASRILPLTWRATNCSAHLEAGGCTPRHRRIRGRGCAPVDLQNQPCVVCGLGAYTKLWLDGICGKPDREVRALDYQVAWFCYGPRSLAHLKPHPQLSSIAALLACCMGSFARI